MENLGHLLRSSLSLRSRAQPNETESSDHGELGGGASLGAITGPLADVRAPQRVSTPPSSGLAAAPLFSSPASSSPGSAFLLPRRPRAGSGGFLLPSLSHSPISFRFCSSLIRTNVGNGVRVRVRVLTLFFSPSPFGFESCSSFPNWL